MTKLMITSTGEELDSLVEIRFGRAPYFIFCNVESGEQECVPNPGKDASGGAGVKAAQFLVDKGVEVLITGKVGPHAESALKETGIKVYGADSSMRVKEALDNFSQGNLKQIL